MSSPALPSSSVSDISFPIDLLDALLAGPSVTSSPVKATPAWMEHYAESPGTPALDGGLLSFALIIVDTPSVAHGPRQVAQVAQVAHGRRHVAHEPWLNAHGSPWATLGCS